MWTNRYKNWQGAREMYQQLKAFVKVIFQRTQVFVPSTHVAAHNQTHLYIYVHTYMQAKCSFFFLSFFLIWQGGWSNGSVVQRTYYSCRGPGFDLKNPPGSSQMSDTQEIKSLKTANKKIIFSVSIFWEMWGCKMAKSRGQARYFVCQQFFRSCEQFLGTSYLIIVTTMLSIYIHFLHNFSLPFSFPHFTSCFCFYHRHFLHVFVCVGAVVCCGQAKALIDQGQCYELVCLPACM